MALQDQIKAAQAEGYNSQEIVQYLAQSNPQVQEAMKEGYQPDEIINFLNQAPTGVQTPTDVIKQLIPTAMAGSKKLGTMVQAGGAGIGDIDANLLAKAINNIVPGTVPEQPLSQSVMQAGQDVSNVEAGQPPTSTSGAIGKTVGSFFTPNQIALQATGGALAEPIATGLGNVATPVIKGLVNAFPRLSELVGAAPEAVSALAENPQAIAAAKSLPETAQDVASTIQGLSKKGMDIASAGKEALSDTTPVVGLRDKLMNYAANIANSPGADEADQAAADYVSKYAKNLDLNPSEADVNDLIEDLDDKINTKYNKANPGPLLDAKIAVRRTLSQALQNQNPAYAKAMAQASATFAPTETLSQSFGVQSGSPSDRTINAIINKSNPNALATQRALTAIPGLSDVIANAAAKDALQQSLLGKLGLYLAPKVSGIVQGGIQSLPAIGNAAAQTVNGLTQ
jgi:hypothetical protein